MRGGIVAGGTGLREVSDVVGAAGDPDASRSRRRARYRDGMKTFEDLVAGRVPAHRVWEDERHLAFLSPRPIRPGHVIVLPKEQSAYVFDLGEEQHRALWDAVRTVARGLEAALGCERVCLAVVGWEVRHVHVHLVPTDRPGEFPALSGAEASEGELASSQARIAAALASK